MTRQQLLDCGQAEASNLSECLSIDFAVLVQAVSPGAPAIAWEKGIKRKFAQAAEAIHANEGLKAALRLADWPSDTVRGIAAMIAMRPDSEPIQQRLDRIRPFADDPHFGVREWAWMAARPHLANQLEEATQRLIPWTTESSPRIRRFATEVLRPRGVWCKHIEVLKTNPERALAILEPLRADPEKYVQDSVSNWLNDAAKTQPEWVKSLCARWNSESKFKATARITKRALRSLN